MIISVMKNGRIRFEGRLAMPFWWIVIFLVSLTIAIIIRVT